MSIVRTRARHGTDLDQAGADGGGLRSDLAGAVGELRRLDRPGPGAIAREVLLVVAIAVAVGAYLLGADHLVGALIGLIFP